MNKTNALGSEASTSNNVIAGVNLTPCAVRAGIPFPTWGSSGLAKLYGLPLSGPVPVERADLGDLVWAVSLALNGLIPVQPCAETGALARVVEFPSFLHGRKEVETVRIVATLRQGAHGQTVLNLSVPDEPQHALRFRVLVIDDDEQVNKCMCLLLRRRGFDVVALSSGVHAVEVARQEMPDLILLDVDLPDANGFALCRALKAETQTSGIPVVLCSGRHGLKKEAAAVGALDCLEKPLELIGLPERLHQILDHQRAANTPLAGHTDSSNHESNS
jgi:CheY-like chemotaxis protein